MSSRKISPVRMAIIGAAVLVPLIALLVLMGPELFLRYLLLGLPQGAIIALIAVGYSMVYGIILLINFAHGEIFMLSAYLALMFLWLPSEIPTRLPGVPLYAPVIVATLLMLTTMVTFHTFAGASSFGVLRRPAMRWPLGVAVAGAVAWLVFQAFLSHAWLSVLAAMVLAGCSFAAVTIAGRGAMPTLAPRLAAGVATGMAVGGAAWWLLQGQVFWAAVVASAALTATIGVSLDSIAYKPLRTAPRLIPLITAIGMSICFQSMAQVIWSADPRILPDHALPKLFRPPTSTMVVDDQTVFITNEWLYEQPLGTQISVGHCIMLKDFYLFEAEEPIRIPIADLVILLMGVAVMAILTFVIYRTKLGRSMRACSEDKTTARLVGVNVDAVVASTFVIGAVMAALVSPLWVIKYASVEPTMGLIVGILAFASAVLGGIGDIRGAMIGGMVIGIIYNFVPAFENIDNWAMVQYWGWMSEDTAFYLYDHYLMGLSKWRLGVAFAFMIAVIVIRPTGLFGQAPIKRA